MEEELEEQEDDIWIKTFSIKIAKYFSYDPSFNSVFSINDLLKIKDGAYVINLYNKKLKEPIEFYYLLTKMYLYTFLDSFGIECIPQEVLEKSKINQLLTIYLE